MDSCQTHNLFFVLSQKIDAHCTKDGVLVVNHDVELSETTDVADWDWAKPLRTRTKVPTADGEPASIVGWAISDFTLDQIKRLRVKMRDDSRSRSHDLLYEIPTVEETANCLQSLIDSVHTKSHNDEYSKEDWLEARRRFTLRHGYARANVDCGLYIETKRPGYYRSIGLPLEERLVDVLEASTFKGPVIIQSFELDSLKLIRQYKPEWKTVKLLTLKELDLQVQRNTLDSFMENLALHCDGIGPNKRSIISNPESPPEISQVIQTAHANGLVVHPYTFRSDITHLHRVYGGNATREFADFFELGVDGVFADFPDHAIYARESCNHLREKAELTNERTNENYIKDI